MCQRQAFAAKQVTPGHWQQNGNIISPTVFQSEQTAEIISFCSIPSDNALSPCQPLKSYMLITAGGNIYAPQRQLGGASRLCVLSRMHVQGLLKDCFGKVSPLIANRKEAQVFGGTHFPAKTDRPIREQGTLSPGRGSMQFTMDILVKSKLLELKILQVCRQHSGINLKPPARYNKSQELSSTNP